MKDGALIVPALRGFFGDWVYYSCLMKLSDLAHNVDFAEALHPNRGLSDWIQRRLEEARGSEIAQYLRSEQRFFNSLVVAVYGGDPAWYEAGDIRPVVGAPDLPQISEETRFSIGFLSLSGRERLFAVDGQHRLAGIKVAVEQGAAISDDDASVLMISHKNDAQGMERTRRLFTTLNKTARNVAKKDIIALDEDDVMAVCVRRLIDEHPYFTDGRIALNNTSNLHHDDQKSFTSIVNLYDVLLALFRVHPSRKKKKQLQFNRPAPADLDRYYDLAVSFFEALVENFPPLAHYMRADVGDDACAKLRAASGGHILFRPIGLLLYARLAAELHHMMDMPQSVQVIAKLPTSLTAPPYVNVLWNKRQGRMQTDNDVLVFRVLRYMLGDSDGEKQLSNDYAKALDLPQSQVRLPKQISKIWPARNNSADAGP